MAQTPSPLQLLTPPGAGPIREERIYPRGKSGPTEDSVQRAMQFLDTPQPSGQPAAQIMPSVHFQVAGVAATPDAAESGGIAAEPSASGRPALFEGFEQSRIGELLLWKRPVASLVAVVLGALALATGEFALRGKHSMTLLTGVAYVLLADVAANFVRSMVSTKWWEHAAWGTSEVAAAAAAAASEAVSAIALVHDRLLMSRDPELTLRTAGALWALAILGRLLSIWRLLGLAFVVAFSVPYIVEANRHRLRKWWQEGRHLLQTKLEALRVGRGVKGVVLAVVLLMALLRCGWADRASAALLALLLVRCHLSTSEVEAITATAEPYAASAKKRARRLSLAAGELVSRRMSMGGAAKPHRR